MSDFEYILENLQIMCEQNDLKITDIICYYFLWATDEIHTKDTIYNQIKEFQQTISNDYLYLDDLHQFVEDNEEQELAIGRVKNILDLILGE